VRVCNAEVTRPNSKARLDVVDPDPECAELICAELICEGGLSLDEGGGAEMLGPALGRMKGTVPDSS